MLVCLAHGSRDPRHGAVVEAIAAAVRARRPGLDVRVAYLDHGVPRVHDVIASLGGLPAVAVPLLLGNAFHGRVDVPAALREALARHPRARLGLAPVLGPDRALLTALDRRLSEVDAAGGDAVVLASAGTSDPAARAALARLARAWRRGGPPVTTAFAAGPGPRVGEAVEAHRAAGAERVVVASWFLAPGLLHDRVRAGAHGAGVAIADVLGPAPEVSGLVLARYDAAARRTSRRAA